MQRQTEGQTNFPPFAQRIFERGAREGKRDALLRLLARAGIALNETERARIEACTDPATLDHWIDNVIGARTANDVLA